MDHNDLLKSGLGAVIGFLLAQFVNFGKLWWDWWRKPKLRIEHTETGCLLSHTTGLSSGEMVEEKYYGFEVRNTGKRVATGVQFQIVKIEKIEDDGAWAEIENTALGLSTYHGAAERKSEAKATIVPHTPLPLDWRLGAKTTTPSDR